MKKIFISGTILFCSFAGFAQIYKSKPKPITLPSPKLRVLKPADLEITGISLNSITKDASNGVYLINVSLTIKNTGEMASQSGKLKGFNTSGYHGYKAPNHPPMKDINDWNRSATEAVPAPWTVCYDEVSFPAVVGGASLQGDYQFKMRFDESVNREKFYFLVMADLYNSTKESNELNNYSTAIFITPPAH